ncbi:hypothetical protein [Prosthecobacter sp.]|uniref:hypothetical protein n=1 Tax=Prosthecobacter sp. TaxID=1965333 RepID=UPI003783CC77
MKLKKRMQVKHWRDTQALHQFQNRDQAAKPGRKKPLSDEWASAIFHSILPFFSTPP